MNIKSNFSFQVDLNFEPRGRIFCFVSLCGKRSGEGWKEGFRFKGLKFDGIGKFSKLAQSFNLFFIGSKWGKYKKLQIGKDSRKVKCFLEGRVFFNSTTDGGCGRYSSDYALTQCIENPLYPKNLKLLMHDFVYSRIFRKKKYIFVSTSTGTLKSILSERKIENFFSSLYSYFLKNV